MKISIVLFCAIVPFGCQRTDFPASHSKKHSPKLAVEYFCRNSVAGPAIGKVPGESIITLDSSTDIQPEETARKLFQTQAKDSKWSLSGVKKLTLEKAFGRSLVSSSYLLFEASFLHNGVEKKKFAIVKKDGACAKQISSCSQFNELVDSLDRGLKSEPDTLLLVRTFLLMTGVIGAHDVILDKASGLSDDELSGITHQFLSNPSYRLTEPIFQKKNGRILVSFWSWNRISGALRRHVLNLDSKGRIIQYTQERLGGRVGHVKKI